MQEFNLTISNIDFPRLMAMQLPPDLRAELEQAIVVPAELMRTGVVTMGSRVRYRDQVTGFSREVEIVFPEEADLARGKVSVLAPVGAALIGLSENQEIEWDFPDGSVHRLTVVAVAQPPLQSQPEQSSSL